MLFRSGVAVQGFEREIENNRNIVRCEVGGGAERETMRMTEGKRREEERGRLTMGGEV